MAKTPARTLKRRKSKGVSGEAGEELNSEERSEQTVCSEEQEEKEEEVTEVVTAERTEREEEETNENEPESAKDVVIEVRGRAPTVSVTEQKDDEEQGDEAEEVGPCDPMAADEVTGSVNGKRKSSSDVESIAPKKTKLINDGYCLFIGNLSHSRPYNELRDSLSTFLMGQGLLFQDVRLDRSKKHAHVDLASELDLTKALALDGQTHLDSPLRVARAKVKTVEEVQKKTPRDKKASRNARCLFLKNLPYKTSKKEIMNLFGKVALDVRFPGGTDAPTHGMAFVEFRTESIAKKVHRKKQGARFQGRSLIVDFAGARNVTETKEQDENAPASAAAAAEARPPNNTLFVTKLLPNVKEKDLKSIFPKAVDVKLAKSKGRCKGFAFVEFPCVDAATKALESTQETKIRKRLIAVHFYQERGGKKSEPGSVDPKTLMVRGLASETTAETLKEAFEGASAARIAADKESGASKKFGFVEFQSEETCKAAKDAMEDCEIDGSTVTVVFARAKADAVARRAAKGERSAERPAGKKRTACKRRHGSRSRNRNRGGEEPGASLGTDAATEDVENKG